jgi:multidrug efflux pump subunit AcrA (membrane-fusion protein)
MKRRRIVIIVICLVAVGIVLAAVLTRGGGSEAVPTTFNVTRGDILKSIIVDGNLQMPNKAYLSFGMTGTVTEVLVEEGNNVTEDQLLARLDAPSLESAVEMAELQVQMAEEQVKMARSQYEKAKEAAEDDWEAPDGWEFLEDVIEFLTGSMVQDEDTAKGNLEIAELNLEMAELSLESAELNLQKAEMVAPFDGVVGDVTISEGLELSATTMTVPAITLVGTSDIEMRGSIDEIDISVVELGQEVNILLDALPDREVKGRVAFISPIGTSLIGVVSYDTTITLEDPAAGLRDGMTATAEVIIERRDDVLLIPNRALRGTWENPKVLVFLDGQQEEMEITLGLTDGINVEVLSGLEEGDAVVLPASGEQPSFFFGPGP